MVNPFPVLQQSALLYGVAASSCYAIAIAHFSEAGGSLPKQDSKQCNEVTGALLGSVVLRAFSIELAIKAVCLKRGMAYPKTHDLAKLFGILPSDDQAAAAKGYKQKHPQLQGWSGRASENE